MSETTFKVIKRISIELDDEFDLAWDHFYFRLAQRVQEAEQRLSDHPTFEEAKSNQHWNSYSYDKTKIFFHLVEGGENAPPAQHSFSWPARAKEQTDG